MRLPTTDDHVLAARIAEAAGGVLMQLRNGPGGGSDGARALGREGDRRSHELITAALHEARPHDAVLSEESTALPGGGAQAPSGGGAQAPPGGEGAGPSAARGGGGDSRVWVVDPLDGTREYAEGRTDFAVHVALVVDGEPVVGAVALPGEGLVFATATSRSDTALPPRPGGPLRIAVSRTRPPPQAEELVVVLGAQLVPMGSAGAKAMAVLRGDVDAYVHAGGQYEWDSAAPVAVARFHGAHASRLDGSPLVYDQPDPWLPDLLVCRPELVDAIGAALRG